MLTHLPGMAVQIKAGLRVAVQPHGGHFWSSMGQVERPMDIVSLRIDNQVRSQLSFSSPYNLVLGSRGCLIGEKALLCIVMRDLCL